jgi:hypothetical protein
MRLFWASFALELCSIIFNLVHYWEYDRTGVGNKAIQETGTSKKRKEKINKECA